MSHVRINLAGPTDQAVELDGHDISGIVREVTVNCRAGDVPAVTLDLAVFGGTTIDGKAEVYLSQRVLNLLQMAGWTPPGDNPYAGLVLDEPGALGREGGK